MEVGVLMVQMGWYPDGLSVRLPLLSFLHHKIQKMAEVDKGCSKFCVIVGTATRTASILIHSW